MSLSPKTLLGPATRVRLEPHPPSSSQQTGTAQPSLPSVDDTASSSAAVRSGSTSSGGGRKGNKKTRTGCITCKIRRVKCDEAKPSCLRCTKTGRNCDGYAPVASKHRSRDRQSPDDHASALSLTQSSNSTAFSSLGSGQPLYALSAKADWSSSEQRAFRFYQECSASGLFSPVSAAFWTKVIPALCYQEPAIRYAVFAIGNLHETYSQGHHASNLSLSSFAAAQYGRALRQLQTWVMPTTDGTSGTVETLLPLLTCALFICIEFMLGNASAAHIHILQGRRLLVHYDGGDSRSPAAELVRRELVPIYTRVSVASFLLGTLPEPIPLALRWTSPAATHLEGFTSLTDAAQAIYELLDDSYHFVQETKFCFLNYEDDENAFAEGRAHFQVRGQELLDRLNMWEDAFACLDFHPDDPTSIVARLYYHSVRIFVGPSMERHECRYDSYTASFASIVMLAGRLLDLEDIETAAQPGPRFSFESGILPPVYSTVIKCRHPVIRRAALGLLKRRAAAQYTENLWDTHQVRQIAEQVMTVEEGVLDEGYSEGGFISGNLESLPELGELPVDWLPVNFYDDGSGLAPQYPGYVSAPPPPFDLGACPDNYYGGLPSQTTRESSPPETRHLRRSPEELLADMVRQSARGALDPGAMWVLQNPVPPERYIAEERRIRIVAVRGRNEGKSSISTYFVQPDTGVILQWGVLYRDTVAKTEIPS
ncbi:hypothetical protein F5X68DRAFT_216501 [Plectosphaerella plurivora]|uniref:Zn(2)-C6 fungal-type domain-containing protein n=1 Tax=Plectosphaerella plurivora TaxID=936078 RepID=A0A9P9A4A4_9PEZI|nr:hypothetical protein F5X68DRAFT_216501 [Plectosphaerella plurivora]